jgi:hypothetical protein
VERSVDDSLAGVANVSSIAIGHNEPLKHLSRDISSKVKLHTAQLWIAKAGVRAVKADACCA